MTIFFDLWTWVANFFVFSISSLIMTIVILGCMAIVMLCLYGYKIISG